MRLVHTRRVHLYGFLFMPRVAPIGDLLRTDRLVLGGREAMAAFVAASPRLGVAAIVLGAVGGLLGPAFALASGALVDAVSQHGDVVVPIAALGLVFLLQRLIDPVREVLGRALWVRVDEHLDDRTMVAMSRPVGLQELEDPAVHDRIAQVRGTVIGFTPGQAAQQATLLIQQRVSAVASMLIVARWSWWAALLLLVVYTLSYNVVRRHYIDVTLAIFGRTERLRRAYYLRTLALSSRMAKETRIFDLAGWLVGQYRAGSLAAYVEIWRRRQDGWLTAVVIGIVVALAEAFVLGQLAREAIGAAISVGVATAVAQSMLAAGRLSQYEDFDHATEDAQLSIAQIRELEHSTRATTILSGTRSADGLPRRGIRFESVSFSYPGRDSAVFDGFNLEIQAGRSLAIVGENGAGKTTLVKLLTQAVRPDGGTDHGRRHGPARGGGRGSGIGACRRSSRTSPASSCRRTTTWPSARSTRGTIAPGAQGGWRRRDAGRDRAARAAAGTRRSVASIKAGMELSGGEWQRLALARALFGVASGAGRAHPGRADRVARRARRSGGLPEVHRAHARRDHDRHLASLLDRAAGRPDRRGGATGGWSRTGPTPSWWHGRRVGTRRCSRSRRRASTSHRTSPNRTGCNRTMRDGVRALVLMIEISLRADAPRTVQTIVAATLATVSLPLRAIGFKMFIDGIVGGDVTLALSGVGIVVGLGGLNRLMYCGSR